MEAWYYYSEWKSPKTHQNPTQLVIPLHSLSLKDLPKTIHPFPGHPQTHIFQQQPNSHLPQSLNKKTNLTKILQRHKPIHLITLTSHKQIPLGLIILIIKIPMLHQIQQPSIILIPRLLGLFWHSQDPQTTKTVPVLTNKLAHGWV